MKRKEYLWLNYQSFNQESKIETFDNRLFASYSYIISTKCSKFSTYQLHISFYLFTKWSHSLFSRSMHTVRTIHGWISHTYVRKHLCQWLFAITRIFLLFSNFMVRGYSTLLFRLKIERTGSQYLRCIRIQRPNNPLNKLLVACSHVQSVTKYIFNVDFKRASNEESSCTKILYMHTNIANVLIPEENMLLSTPWFLYRFFV